MNCELKDRIVSMCELCDSIERVMKSNGRQASIEDSYRDIFLTDVAKYVLFLIAMNDELSGQESLFFKEYLNMSVSQEDFEDLIELHGLDDSECVHKIPTIMEIFVDADNLVYKLTGGHEFVASAELAELFRMIGLEFLNYGENLGGAVFFAVPYAANLFAYIDTHVDGVTANVQNGMLDFECEDEDEAGEENGTEEFEDITIYDNDEVRIDFCGMEFINDEILLNFWVCNRSRIFNVPSLHNVSVNGKLYNRLMLLDKIAPEESEFRYVSIKDVPDINFSDIKTISFSVVTSAICEKDRDSNTIVCINCDTSQETFDVETISPEDQEVLYDTTKYYNSIGGLTNTSIKNEDLETLLAQLNSLTGLDSVKNDVTTLINLIQIRKVREERGLKQMPLSLHMVFSGNPGTGKTTVARLLAKIYYQLGVLSNGHLVEVDRSGLVAGYVGHTALKVQSVLQKALGGVLFIDEAYSLTANKGENDFGAEAVETLLKGMEDNRDNLIVIVAGYPDLMNEFLNSNPGLRSRFNKVINFVDYTPAELTAIFKGMCSEAGYCPNNECLTYVGYFFEKRYQNRDKNFANARDVRNFFEKAVMNQANRLTSNPRYITDELLTTLTFEDVVEINI